MAKPLKPFVRSGGYYPSAKYTPLVYPGGYTTLNAKNGKPEPSDPLNTFVGKIVRFLAKRSLPMVKLEANFTPIQNLNGYDAPWPPGGGKNKAYTSLSGGSIGGTGNIGESTSYDAAIAKVEQGKTYTVTTNDSQLVCAFYEEEPYIGITASYNSSRLVQASKTFVAPISGYIAFRVLIGYSTYQCEEGSTATAFAPYSNICPISGHTGCDIFDKAEYDAQATPTVSISFGQTVYSGTLTVFEDGSGELEATHKYYENAGTGTWGEVTTGGARYYIGGVSSDSKGDSPNGWCNIGKLVSNFTSDGVVVGSNGRINLCGSLHDAFASTDALKTYLASNPLQVVYELATPITIPLTASQINTLVGTNTVWVDSATGDITVQAYGTEIV